MNSDQTLGSYDFYFDIAEQLQALGCQFSLVVLHPGTSNIAAVTNVEDPVLAKKMLEGLDKTFRDQFNG